MNTRKAYKMLLVALFFVFISLISRSIIYLVLSVTIATMILFLLGSNKKFKKEQKSGNQLDDIEKQNKGFNFFLWLLVIGGGVLLGYGSLFFTESTVVPRFMPIPEQISIAIITVVIGFCIVLSGLYFLLREALQVRHENEIYCGHCGAKNHSGHTFCHSCGGKLN